MKRPGPVFPNAGLLGAGAGAAVGKMPGREHATLGGVGYAALKLAANVTVAAVAVANASRDVLAPDGTVLAGAHGENGELIRSADLIAQTPELTDWAAHPGQSTTLARVHALPRSSGLGKTRSGDCAGMRAQPTDALLRAETAHLANLRGRCRTSAFAQDRPQALSPVPRFGGLL